MPAPIGPLVGFALGAALAWIARGYPEPADVRGLPRPTTLAVLFACLVFAPVCAYFLAFAGDWSFAYFVDSRSIPSAAILVLLVADAASVLLGFSFARGYARRRAVRAVATLTAAPLFSALILVLVGLTRLRVDGTFLQVRGDFGTQPVAGGPLGYAILWMQGMLVAGFAYTARLLRDRPRSSPPSSSLPPPPPASAVRRSRPPSRPNTRPNARPNT